MKKKIVSVILTTVMVLSMTACGSDPSDPTTWSKQELLSNYTSLQANFDSLAEDLDNLQIMYDALAESNPTSAISYVGDGTGTRLTFNSADSKIIFPDSFKYPESEQISANGSIEIVQNISVTPGNNWVCKLNGASLELEHSTGISGVIKIGRIQSMYDKSLLQDEVLAPWFSNVPSSTLVYNKIFLGNEMQGVQATTPTTIDSEDAYLRAGILGYGNYSVTYIFVYRGNQDSTKDESILSVLNSIEITGSKLSVE